MRAGRIGLALLMALLAAWFVLLRPVSLGGSVMYIVIRGDSMEPDFLSGDLLIVQAAASYETSDVIAYRVPVGEVGEGMVVVHRIVGGSASGGFEMRGDNNQSTDPWTPHGTDVVGKAWVLIPGLGRVLVAIRQPLVLAALAASLVVGLVIWRGPAGRPPASAPMPTGRGAAAAGRGSGARVDSADEDQREVTRLVESPEPQPRNRSHLRRIRRRGHSASPRLRSSC